MKFFIFKVGERIYAIDVNSIIEIRKVLETKPVPGLPEYVDGVGELRGDIVMLVDLRKLFGRGMHNKFRIIIVKTLKETLLGLVVDNALEVVDVDEMKPPPPIMKEKLGESIRGIFTIGDKEVVVVLEPVKFVDIEKLRALTEM